MNILHESSACNCWVMDDVPVYQHDAACPVKRCRGCGATYSYGPEHRDDEGDDVYCPECI